MASLKGRRQSRDLPKTGPAQIGPYRIALELNIQLMWWRKDHRPLIKVHEGHLTLRKQNPNDPVASARFPLTLSKSNDPFLKWLSVLLTELKIPGLLSFLVTTKSGLRNLVFVFKLVLTRLKKWRDSTKKLLDVVVIACFYPIHFFRIIREFKRHYGTLSNTFQFFFKFQTKTIKTKSKLKKSPNTLFYISSSHF